MDEKNWVTVTTFVLSLVALITIAVTAYQTYVTRDTAVRQLRAYVGVGDPHFGEKFPNKVTIEIENGGQTPAYEVRGHLNRFWYPKEEKLPENFDYKDLGESIDASVAHLNPGQKRTLTFPFDTKELERARDGEINLILYGHFDYIDIYQKSRTSRFSYQYIGFNTVSGGVAHVLKMQGIQNDAD